jgi:hypothetical protein
MVKLEEHPSVIGLVGVSTLLRRPSIDLTKHAGKTSSICAVVKEWLIMLITISAR